MSTLVVLGDSISDGVGSSHPLAGFAKRLGAAFVIARPGWTSSRLLKEVQKQPTAMWEMVDHVVILIGGNDLMRALPFLLSSKTRELVLKKVLEQYEKNLLELITLLKDHFQGRILLVTLYNPLPKSSIAKKCISSVNQIIITVGDTHQIEIVDLYKTFQNHEDRWIQDYNQGQLSDIKLFGNNPIHPGDEGHSAIARTISVYLNRKLGLQNKRKNQSVQKNKPRRLKKLRPRPQVQPRLKPQKKKQHEN